MISNAEILIIGGSETTASLLSGVTYFLLQNPAALQQLEYEVRTVFGKQEEIDLISVSKLPYMLACLDEAMRMYPPIANGLPRVCPKGGSTVLGEYLPENVSKSLKWLLRSSVGPTNNDLIHRQLFQSTSGRCIAAKNISKIRIPIVLSGFCPIRSLKMTAGMHSNPSIPAQETVLGESMFTISY